jgi:hypothetical protein
MISGWTRAFILTAVASLLANAQCYVNCAAAACNSNQPPCDSCPRHSSSPENQAACPHQQNADFVGPEVRVAAESTPAMVASPALSTHLMLMLQEPTRLMPSTANSPPGSHDSSAISALRI